MFELNYTFGYSWFGETRALLIVDTTGDYVINNIEYVLANIFCMHTIPSLVFVSTINGAWVQVHVNADGEFDHFSAPDPKYSQYFAQGIN